MNRSLRVIAYLVTAVVFSSAAASAAPILSGDGEQWTSTLAGVCAQVGEPAPCGGTTVAVGAHPAWMDAGATDAQWVSYAATGYDGTIVAPRAGTLENPDGRVGIMTITETFVGLAGTAVNVRLWADDTLRVFFNGAQVKAPVFGQNTCADAPIGCEPDEYWDFIGTSTGGLDTLTLVAYQVGSGSNPQSNPFGVLYTGSYTQGTPEQVPEPLTMTLLGGGLLGLALRRRSRRTR